MGWESKPSSVPDGHLSRPQKGPATSSPSWRLSTSGLGEQPASGRFGDCCGEDCPFHPGGDPPVWSLLLSRGMPRANLDCRRAISRAPPRLSPGTRALCSSDFPLAPKRQRPSLPTPCLSCQCAGLTQVVGHGYRVMGRRFRPIPYDPRPITRQGSAVPKGRFELPRGYPHYALNVARLPVPPLRLVVRPPFGGRSRPPDLNRGPAVYEAIRNGSGPFAEVNYAMIALILPTKRSGQIA